MSVRSGNIDALRGFAILFVIQFHLFSTTGAYETVGTPQAVQRVLAYGWAGVDLFFVLSAYLLTRNLARQEATPSVIGRFYLRRAFRILPLYWVVLAAGFGLAQVMDPDARTWLWRDHYPLTTYLLFVQNLFYGLDGRPVAHFFAPTWSLAVEEHFYLVLPFAVLFVARRRLRHLAIAAVILTPLLRHAVETGVNPVAAYVWTVTRLDSFAWGILIALLQPRLEIGIAPRRALLLPAAAAIGCVVAICLPVARPGEMDGLVAITVMAFCAAAATLSCVSAAEDGRISRVLSFLRDGLRWAGERCFSLYLVHMPMLGLTFLAIGVPVPFGGSAAGVTVIVASLVLSLLLASVTYNVIEQPFMRLGERLTSRAPRQKLAAGHV